MIQQQTDRAVTLAELGYRAFKAEPMMSTPTQVVQMARGGFLNAGPLLADAEVEALSSELDRILEIGPDGFGPDDPKPVLFRDLRRSVMLPVLHPRRPGLAGIFPQLSRLA